ncbi:hypothetical protein [Oceanisphaera sp. W20_SRM_FM3]|uniref:hypothetical protein n=1 Tax=Oceanisphaera sp. W20_SRM_FM3 TaxID=3240267 RepID=UPI003F95C6B1
MTPFMKSYQQFYHSQIKRAQVSNGDQALAGLITINGPTGLGKTSAITEPSPKGDRSVLSELMATQLQGVFITHRWNILHQVAADVQAQGFTVSVIYARQEQVLAAVLGRPYAHEDPNLAHGDWSQHLASLTAAGLWVNAWCSVAQLGELCSTIKRLALQLQNLATWPNSDDLKQQCEYDLNVACKQLETAILQNMAQLKPTAKQEQSNGKRRRQLGVTTLSQSPWHQYRAHPWIRRLLPAVAWHDEQQPLLIMSTQKFYHGFYDGMQRARMADAKTHGHVIFIDEFEYQEPVLLSLLSQAQRIQEIPQCLGVLLDEGMRAIPRFRAANRQDEHLNRVLDELEQHFTDTQARLKEQGILFPRHRALIQDEHSPFISRYLFHSDYTITDKPTYLLPQDHSLLVANTPSANSVNAGYFFSELEQLLRHTLAVLARLPIEAQLGSGNSVRNEFMHLLFNGVNDYRSGHYQRHFSWAVLMGDAPNTHLPELAELAKTNTLPHTQAQLHGFSCWLFTPATEQIDKLRIRQKRAHIPTTPEALLVALASRNLVFGLSATAMLARTVGHFDMRWVYGALHEISRARQLASTTSDKPEPQPIPITPNAESDSAQQQLIQHLQHIKADRRNNQFELQVTDFTEHTSPVGQCIRQALAQLPADFFQDDNQATLNTAISETALEYRSHSLHAMLRIICLAAVSEEYHLGHLAYANSIRFMRKWLECPSAQASRACLASVLSVKPAAEQAGFETFLDSSSFVPLWCSGQPLILCLLTAQSQRDLMFAQHYAQAFSSGVKVVVLTQVASATNGINLNTPMLRHGQLQDQDLSCLYLYEGRHFYFSPPQQQPGQPPMVDTGFHLRQLQKLRQASYLSEFDYRHFIASLMQGNAREISRLNNQFYKNTFDYVLNLTADVQQQVGRIERVWAPMAHTRVVIHNTLADTLQQYADDPHGYAQHKPMLSCLNQGVFAALQERQDPQSALALLFSSIQDAQQIKEVIDQHLIGRIRRSREPDQQVIDVTALQRTWETLGRAALRRDLACQFSGQDLGLPCATITLKEWACIILPAGADPVTGVWRRPDNRFMASSSPEASRYRLAPLYRWVNHHQAINQWFKRHGYATSGEINSGLEEQYLFHPAFSQRILQGRIGEESIRALFAANQLSTHSGLLHKHTLEVYDFHLSGTPLYVDAKYWGLNSLAQAEAKFQAWLAAPASVDNYWQALSDKVKQLRQYGDPNARLVVINLVGSEADASLKGVDLSLAPTDIATAPILVLAGALHPEHPNSITSGFNGLCELAHRYLAQSYINPQSTSYINPSLKEES